MSKPNENKRARNWCAVVYPDSAPENWKEQLDALNIKWACSPLHDKDVDDDGVIKKAHYHIIICHSGNKSFEQIRDDLKFLNCPIPQICRDVRSSTRYLVHLDHPHKYQYNRDDIECYGGFDLSNIMALSSSEKKQVITEVLQYIRDNNVTEYYDLVNYCMDEKHDTWFPVIIDGYSILITNYIKSYRNMLETKAKKAKEDYN